jgi:hypothetical protein
VRLPKCIAAKTTSRNGFKGGNWSCDANQEWPIVDFPFQAAGKEFRLIHPRQDRVLKTGNILPYTLILAEYTPLLTYGSKCGTRGNDRHLPSFIRQKALFFRVIAGGVSVVSDFCAGSK